MKPAIKAALVFAAMLGVLSSVFWLTKPNPPEISAPLILTSVGVLATVAMLTTFNLGLRSRSSGASLPHHFKR